MLDMKYSEAAEFLGMEIGSVYKLISGGKLHAKKVAGSREKLLDRAEVIRYRYRKQPEVAEKLIRELTATQDAERATEKNVEQATTSPTPVYLTDSAGIERMFERGIALRLVQSKPGEMLFQPALVDENDSQEEQSTPSLLLLVVILLGLALLFKLNRHNSNVKRAERTLEQIAIEKEELEESQREQAIEKLKHYPREAQELKNILREEHILPAFV